MHPLWPLSSLCQRYISFFILFREDPEDSLWASKRPSSYLRIRLQCFTRSFRRCSASRRFSWRHLEMTSLNMRSWVVGIRKDSRRCPRQCRDASKVSEADWSPPTAMSKRCSQTATQRVLAWSKTLMSLVPSKEMLDTYVFMAGSRSFAASGSTRLMVLETLAQLVRWYSAIMQLTWFLSFHASRGRISGCKCIMAQAATSSRGDGCSPAYS